MKNLPRLRFFAAWLALGWAATVVIHGASPVQAVSLAGSSLPPAAGGNSDSSGSVISSDGRFVLFLGTANNLVTNDDNGKFVDIFLRETTNGVTRLVSVNQSGVGGGNGHSVSPALSSNGRYVVFESEASNLVANDTNGVGDVFLRDVQNGTTTLVSVDNASGEGNGPSTSPLISGDGRYVAFVSQAGNLVGNDANGASDVFVRDLQTGTTTLVSVTPSGGSSGNGASDSPTMTPDGQWVVFVSRATNLVAGATNNLGDIYARNLVSGTTVWVGTNVAAIMAGVNSQTHPINSYNPVISDNGDYVAFKSIGAAQLVLRHNLQTGTTDLVSTNAVGNSIGFDDPSGPEMTPDGRFVVYTAQTWPGTLTYSAVYLWDGQNGTSSLVSANLSGAISASTFSDTPAVSADGRFVTFVSDASDLVTNAADGSYQIYLRDMWNGATKLISADVNGGISGDTAGAIPTLSADGRYVAFDSFDGDYAANDNNKSYDVFVRDATTDTTELISLADVAARPLTADGLSSVSANALSADGRFVAFVSAADNLVTNDTNGYQDVFVRDLQTSSNILVSINSAGTGSANSFSGSETISANGRFVAFVSNARDLTANKTNTSDDIFVRDLQMGTTTLVSVSADGTAGGNASSSFPAISADGRSVAFFSQAKNLVANDLTGGGEIFWRDLQSGSTASVTTNGSALSLFSMSSDGRFVAYFSGTLSTRRFAVWDSQAKANIYSSSLVGAPLGLALSPDGQTLIFQSSSNLDHSIIAHDLTAGTDTVIGYSAVSGGPKSQVSANGRFVTFVSSNNQPGSQSGANNVFLYDLQTATTTLISFNRDRTASGNGPSDSPSISADGRFVVYRSSASDLVEDDNNGLPDIFLFDRLTGTNRLVSVNQTGTASGNDRSSGPAISAAGSIIAFRSVASDLVTGDFNDTQDVYVFQVPTATFTDSDADGMDDAWEKAYFGDLSHTGSGDSDDDGITDSVEFKTGTNPRDPVSRFSAQASLLPGGNQVTIRWPAVPGWSYRVQYNEDLGKTNWNDVSGGVMVNGTIATGVDNAAGTSNHRFYRVTLVE